MGGRTNVFIGLACIALGIGLSLASDRTIYYGLVLVGIFRIARGASAPELSRDKGRPPPPDDPRWQPSAAPQIVGKPCGECGKRFVTADDAEACATCGELVHPGCRLAHGTAKHAAGAYR